MGEIVGGLSEGCVIDDSYCSFSVLGVLSDYRWRFAELDEFLLVVGGLFGEAGVPEWPKGSGLGPDGSVLRGFEPHPPHQIIF